VYIILRKHFLANTPVLKGKSIGFAFFLPIFLIYTGICSIITTASLPDKNDWTAKIEFASKMASQGYNATDGDWEWIYKQNEANAAIGAVLIIVMIFVVLALFKRTRWSSKVILRVVWIAFLICSFIVGALGYDRGIILRDTSEAFRLWWGPVGMAAGMGLSSLLFYWILYHFFKKKVKRIYEYAGASDTPLPFTSGNEKQPEMKEESVQPVIPETKSRIELLLDLKSLLDAGILSQEEFDIQKKNILNS